MCTVTYIPHKEGQYTLTSNRDESAGRSSAGISREERSGHSLAFPRDTLAGGAWIAISSADRLVCLLNGAFDAHDRRPPYRRSRGLMVLDFFDYPSCRHFREAYDFAGMEPFTMIVVERGQLIEWRWDEQRLHTRELDPRQAFIWSSATLYDRSVRERREQWFGDWLSGRDDFSSEAILDFHRHAGEGDPWNDVVMNRGGLVQTVSITSIGRSAASLDMRFESLLNGQVNHEKILLKGELVGLR